MVLTASKNKDRCKCVVYGPVLSYYGGKRVVLMFLSNRMGYPVSKSSGSVHFLGKPGQSPLSLSQLSPATYSILLQCHRISNSKES